MSLVLPRHFLFLAVFRLSWGEASKSLIFLGMANVERGKRHQVMAYKQTYIKKHEHGMCECCVNMVVKEEDNQHIKRHDAWHVHVWWHSICV